MRVLRVYLTYDVVSLLSLLIVAYYGLLKGRISNLSVISGLAEHDSAAGSLAISCRWSSWDIVILFCFIHSF